jgi:tetratricopeptide (TPR) repeat protein
VQGREREAEESCDLLIAKEGECFGTDSIEYADLLPALSHMFYYSGNFRKAEKLYREAIPVLEKCYGTHSKTLASLLLEFAELNNAIKRYDVEQWALRRLIRKAKYDNNRSAALRFEVLLATSHAETGDFDKAEALLRILYRRAELTKGLYMKKAAAAIPRLAGLCVGSGRHELARDLYIANIRMLGTWGRMYSPDLLPGLNGLADLYQVTGDDFNAEDTLKRINGILRKQFLSSKVENNTLNYDRLPLYLEHKGRHAESERLLREELKECGKKFGENSEKTSVMFYNLGNMYLRHGRPDDALEAFDDALAIKRELGGPEDIGDTYILSGQGAALLQNKNYPEANKRFRKALDIYERSGIGETPDLASILFSLADSERGMGNLGAAEICLDRHLAIVEKIYPDEYRYLGSSLVELGGTLNALGRVPEAEKVFERVIRLVEADKEPFWKLDPGYAIAMKMLADIYIQRRELDRAEINYSRALEIFERHEEQHRDWLGTCLEGMARVKLESGLAGEGEAYFSRAIQVYEQTGTIDKEQLRAMKDYLARLRMWPAGHAAWPDDGSGEEGNGSIN